MHIGGYVLDSRQNCLRSDRGEISLSPLGARFLEFMGREPGAVVPRTAIVDALWRGDWLVGNAALNRLVSEVRRALSDDPRDPKLIQTVPRVGYRLIADSAVDVPEDITDEPSPAPDDCVPAPVATVTVLPPAARSETMTWREMWKMANYTVLALGGSIGFIMTIGILAHR